MANYVLSLHAHPNKASALVHLFEFAKACVAKGHHIESVFLYQDAVHYCAPLAIPTDEFQPQSVWQWCKHNGVNVSACITAAERRGINTDEAALPLSGLAEFAMTTAKTDKWVQFK